MSSNRHRRRPAWRAHVRRSDLEVRRHVDGYLARLEASRWLVVAAIEWSRTLRTALGR